MERIKTNYKILSHELLVNIKVMKRYSLTLLFTVTMLLIGVQTAKAQKVVLHMKGNQTFECSISQLDSITFEGDDLIIEEEHEWVDLGLPSGTLWATCNVGANSPEEYGDYFAWGETEPKENYSWSTYKYCEGSYNTMTKYCPQSNYGYNGFTNTLTELLPEDDAATANWGYDWQTPNKTQFEELTNNNHTTKKWTTINGINGELITSKSNGKNIFFPAAGCLGEFPLTASQYGEYWSCTNYTDDNNCAYALSFDENFCSYGNGRRDFGRSVRPVRIKTR